MATSKIRYFNVLCELLSYFRLSLRRCCLFCVQDGRTALDLASRDVIVLLNRLLSYQKRRQPFMMFLSSYQFFRPPARFPRETIIEKTIVAEDLHKFLMSFL